MSRPRGSNSGCLLAGLILAICANSRAQGFQGIVPLESGCDDVKKALHVDICDSTDNVYFLPEYSLTVHLAKEAPVKWGDICYQAPRGKVIAIDVSYNKPPLINNYPYTLEFVRSEVSDIPTNIYSNSRLGLTVISHQGLANTAIFIPTREQVKSLVVDCKP
jgi:hypothetical protein